MSQTRGRFARIIDTNVPVVANRRLGESRECASECAKALLETRSRGKLLLDSSGLILTEYRRHLSLRGEPGVGDAFIKWVHDNLGRRDLLQLVTITPHATDLDSYVEFPADPRLAGFDRSDRKFVAVAVSHGGSPTILNATDRDWWDHRDLLRELGLHVTFLCPTVF